MKGQFICKDKSIFSILSQRQIEKNMGQFKGWIDIYSEEDKEDYLKIHKSLD